MANLPDEDVFRPMTPAERAYCAEMKKRFTVEKLIEYIEDDAPKYPLDQVLAEAETILRERGQAVEETGNG